MGRIFFLAFESAGQYVLVKKLRSLGHKVAVAEPRHPAAADLLRQQLKPPQVFLCDASQRPSHVRETCRYFRGLKAHQATPFIVYNVKAGDEDATRAAIPGAIVVHDDDVVATLDASLGTSAEKA